MSEDSTISRLSSMTSNNNFQCNIWWLVNESDSFFVLYETNYHFFLLDSPLPCYQALPVMKTIRPATTFELQHIRQHLSQTWNNGNRGRYEATRTRDKLQKEVFSMQYVSIYDKLRFNCPKFYSPKNLRGLQITQ